MGIIIIALTITLSMKLLVAGVKIGYMLLGYVALGGAIILFVKSGIFISEHVDVTHWFVIHG